MGGVMQGLREYQKKGVASAVGFARSAEAGQVRLYAAPTGTGKSYVLNEVKRQLGNDCVAIIPNSSIMLGIAEKLQIALPGSESGMFDALQQYGYYTPIRYRNRLLAGELQPAKYLLIDEAHHDNDSGDTGDQLAALTNAIKIGYTGSPWQGTPQGTMAYLKRWGEPEWLIRIKEAIQQGYWTLPECVTWPLVNDDEIDVQNGQLVASQIDSKTQDKLDYLIEKMLDPQQAIFATDAITGARKGDFEYSTLRATCITAPSTHIAELLYTKMRGMGVLCNLITQATPFPSRKRYLEEVYKGHCLIQIRTVGEGTDIHLRCMIDIAPTLSPVLWFQRFGRLTRPGAESRYICTNLNYSRHCYLLEGVAPEVYLRQSISAFGTLSERTTGRVFGLQSLGRLKPTKVKTSGGIEMYVYNVQATIDKLRREYVVIVHPNKPQPFWFEKRSNINGEGDERRIAWGKWERCAVPDRLEGFKSSPDRPLTEKQMAWWNGESGKPGAAHYGLDQCQDVNARVFQVLPIFANFKLRV
jgi:superfamily II DNA or RNA helicase